jgi:hypothetical protein
MGSHTLRPFDRRFVSISMAAVLSGMLLSSEWQSSPTVDQHRRTIHFCLFRGIIGPEISQSPGLSVHF